jgi:hypothetical protein
VINSIWTEVVLFDAHFEPRSKTGDIPFDRHDPRAISVALQIVKELKPDGVTLGGDWMHFGMLSPHVRKRGGSPGNVQMWNGENAALYLSDAWDVGNVSLDLFQAAAPKKCRWRFMEGNHEDWLRKIRNMETYRAVMDRMYLESCLEFKKRKMQFIPYEEYNGEKNWAELGPNLDIFHGTYTSQNFLKKLYDDLENSFLTGHLHFEKEETFQHRNTVRAGYSVGCLCHKRASYHRGRGNRWSQGLAVVFLEKSGMFHVHLIRIIDGHAILDRKMFYAKRLPDILM